MAELKTTSAAIYFGNMDAELEELERLTRADASNAALVLRLSGVLHTRGRFKDDPVEMQRGIDLLATCERLDPTDARCPLARAEQEQSLHRFKQARADLERARTLRGDATRIEDLAAELDWNDGRYDVAIPAIRRARAARPSTGTWMREAQLEHDLGNEEAADRAFERAEDLINDTSPLVVAHLNLQRGIQKASVGRLDEAIVFFRAAVERIPDYVAGNEHLAEALHMAGKDEESTRLYEKVVSLSDDPEFAHALAERYAASGQTEKAKPLAAKARARYEELLKRFPEAMYWHASEYFRAIGERDRARTLLRQNLELRPNATSLVALARIELETGHLPEARAAIDKALAMPLVSAPLFFTASRIYEKVGDAAASARFRERALALNPRIAKDD